MCGERSARPPRATGSRQLARRVAAPDPPRTFRRPMADPGRLLHLADEMAGRVAKDDGFIWLSVLAAHAALESLVNQLGREEIGSFNERARFLPKWHDLCERTLGRQLDAAPDLERLHALRDVVAGFKPGRTNATDITFFKSGGVALEDVAIGKAIYERALEQKVGRELDL